MPSCAFYSPVLVVGVIQNWDNLSSGERAQGILQVAFWGGATGVSARASGGNLTDAFNLRIQTAQADISTGRALTEVADMPDGQISVVHKTDSNGARNIEVLHHKDASPIEVEIHNRVARELASNQGLNGSAYRAMSGEHTFMPGTRGEEVHFEVAKHESLVSHYETAVTGGATELAPRLEQLRGDLANHRADLDDISANPVLGELPARGQIDQRPTNAALVTLAPGGTTHSSAMTPRDVLQPDMLKSFPDARLLDQSETVTIDGKQVTNLGGVNLYNFRNADADGRVFYDGKSDTLILSTNVAVGDGGMLLKCIEIPYAQNPNGEWRADFTNYDALSVSGHGGEIKISPLHPDKTKIESENQMRTRHFREANLQLSALLSNDPNLNSLLKLNSESLELVNANIGSSPAPYTYHHENIAGTLQLIDRNVHWLFQHSGGITEMQNLQSQTRGK